MTETVTANRVAAEVKLELSEVTELREGKGTKGLCRRENVTKYKCEQMQLNYIHRCRKISFSTGAQLNEKKIGVGGDVVLFIIFFSYITTNE